MGEFHCNKERHGANADADAIFSVKNCIIPSDAKHVAV